MTKLSVKTGDNVLIIAGKEKGKVSVVKATSPKSAKVIVEGVNVQSRHTKTKKANEKSTIVKKEGAIDISNVMVVCSACNKATRVARKQVDGKTVRFCKKCGASLESNVKVAKAPKKVKESVEKETNTTAQKPKITKKAPIKNASTPKKVAAKATTKRVATKGDK